MAAPRADLATATSAPTVLGTLRSRRRLAAAALAVVAIANGCGGAATPVTKGGGPNPTSAPSNPPGGALDATAPSAAAPSSTAPGAPERQALPSVIVNDVAAGTKIDLTSVPPPDRPLLIWFWAPH